ncbi:hypothetical protein F6P96_01790 [Escherichia coli]|nr:hypothetical protein F6P96_01790 [Escherichia coli]
MAPPPAKWGSCRACFTRPIGWGYNEGYTYRFSPHSANAVPWAGFYPIDAGADLLPAAAKLAAAKRAKTKR